MIPHMVISQEQIPEDYIQRQLLWALEDSTNSYVDRLNKEEENVGQNSSNRRVGKREDQKSL